LLRKLVGRSERVFLSELNDKSLRVRYPDPNGVPFGEYARVQRKSATTPWEKLKTRTTGVFCVLARFGIHETRPLKLFLA